MNIEAENAVMRERARIREEVMELSSKIKHECEACANVPLAEVLRIVRNGHPL